MCTPSLMWLWLNLTGYIQFHFTSWSVQHPHIIHVIAPYNKSHGPQRAYKAWQGSHCLKVSVSWREQKNFRGIRCPVHQQVEKIWHHSDIIKNWTSSIIDENYENTGQGGCQEAYSNIKGAAGVSAWYWWCGTCEHSPSYSPYVWATGKAG